MVSDWSPEAKKNIRYHIEVMSHNLHGVWNQYSLNNACQNYTCFPFSHSQDGIQTPYQHFFNIQFRISYAKTVELLLSPCIEFCSDMMFENTRNLYFRWWSGHQKQLWISYNSPPPKCTQRPHTMQHSLLCLLRNRQPHIAPLHIEWINKCGLLLSTIQIDIVRP